MLAIEIQPVQIDPTLACTPQTAYVALTDAAQSYLRQLERVSGSGGVPPNAAVITRVRGTGPGVSFGALLAGLLQGIELRWECPFEGSQNVSGAAIRGSDVLQDARRTDGFLVLRFAACTRDLPLHIHPASDRFIFAIDGRGFFHVSTAPLDQVFHCPIRHVPVRDRDALMFRRGAVHTFSTAEHPLTLLSYHQPFIELDDPAQYILTQPPMLPAAFLGDVHSRISFDAAWTCLQ